ncbi:MAG TPA: FdhC protein [Lachnospiraceae bacterium]|nr:FdhC protein [Lachnospiraceae bacterium]
MNLFTPAEIAKNYIAIGKAKVNTPIGRMFLLAVLAGAFIGLGGVGATTAAVSIPYASVGKLVGACIFPGGLTMVLLAGSELFTGNTLLVIPLLEKEIRLAEMLKSWGIVYIGNLVGGFLVAAGIVYSHQISLFNNQMAVSVISTAASKCTLTFGDALIRGIFCNFLVCIAVWISFAAKDVAGKIAGLFFPIMIFVLCGFEHSVANMYYISAGLFANGIPAYSQAALEAGLDTNALTWGNFFIKNLLPVTIGNIIGGAVCVGCAYWFLYLRKKEK